MTSGYLLDTNIAIAILGNEDIVIELVHQIHRDKKLMFFSVITECEVYSGLRHEEFLRAVKLFSPQRSIDVTSKIAKQAAEIRRDQNTKGRKLKTPDALIIATAKTYHLTLVSRDRDMHFIEKELNLSFLKV